MSKSCVKPVLFFLLFFLKHKSEKKIQMPRFVVRPIFRVCFPSAV